MNNNRRNSGVGGGYFDTANKNRTIPPMNNYYNKCTASMGLVYKTWLCNPKGGSRFGWG